MIATAAFDCQRCGACCVNPDENNAAGFVAYVDILPIDKILERTRIMQRYVVTGDGGAMHVRLDRTGRCTALVGRVGGHVRCGIYDDRPRGCRLLQAGSEKCLIARKERGIGLPRRLPAAPPPGAAA